MNYKWVIVFIIFMFMVSSSCATKIAYMNGGKKLPERFYYLQTTGDKPLYVNILFQKFFITKDKGERILVSEELSLFNINKVKNKDLVDIKIFCQIENPDRRLYSVWESFVIHGSEDIFPTGVTRQRYKGRLPSQILTIDIPKIRKGVVTAVIIIKDGDNYSIVRIPTDVIFK